MKVFISWSGDASKAAAEALRDWLPRVIQAAVPWMSDKDIRTGKKWSIEIAKTLQECKFAILVVTADNLEAPWLHFEAGAIAKTLNDDPRVVPYLVGGLALGALEPPLADFQAVMADEGGTRKMVLDLFQRMEGPKPEAEVIKDAFALNWGALKEKLAAVRADKSAEEAGPDPKTRIAEIHSMVRDISSAVSRMESAGARPTLFGPGTSFASLAEGDVPGAIPIHWNPVIASPWRAHSQRSLLGLADHHVVGVSPDGREIFFEADKEKGAVTKPKDEPPPGAGPPASGGAPAEPKGK